MGRCVGSGGVLDLPGYKEDTEVLVYGDQHGGDNQAFDWDTRVGDITSVVDKDLVLLVRDDGKVVLGQREGEARERWVLGSCGVLDDIESEAIHCGSICNLADKQMALTDSKGKLVVEQIKDERPHQTWENVRAEAEEGGKPATSCHLKYPLPAEVENSSFWQLECSVVVRSPSPASYFCVVGWGPAGYSGIQEVDNDKRISVRCVGSGGVLDLPGYKEDTEVLVYGDQHGGDNQAFDWDTRVGDITSVVDKDLVLLMRDDGKAVLGQREGESRERWVLGSCGVLDDIESE